MADRRRVEERIKKKEMEIQELEARIRESRIYVQALQDVLKMFPKESLGAEAEAILRPGSAVAQARELILKLGRPMHVAEILAALGRETTRETKAALGGSIAAYVRKKQIFTKAGPNTFGLIEMDQKGHGEEPPPEFGTDKKRGVDLS